MSLTGPKSALPTPEKSFEPSLTFVRLYVRHTCARAHVRRKKLTSTRKLYVTFLCGAHVQPIVMTSWHSFDVWRIWSIFQNFVLIG